MFIATKVGFFVALAAATGIIVTSLLLWAVLSASGALSSLGGLLSSVLGDGSGFNLESEFSFGNVMGTAITLSLLNLVLTTTLAAVYAAIFNLIAKLVGGISLTFTNNEAGVCLQGQTLVRFCLLYGPIAQVVRALH